MSSTPSNLDRPLELVQKTYNLPTTTNNHENSVQSRPSIAKISINQPSRKTSVHDIHQVNRDHLNKILGDIQENLSRLKVLLETLTSIETIRDEFFKLKNNLLNKILECINKLSNESGKRGSIVSSKRNSSTFISHHPQHLVYCIELFRSELLKAQYLFSSFILSTSIGSGTLNTIPVKSLVNLNIEQTALHGEEIKTTKDLTEIIKDISNLEDHAYLLTQRYYSQIPDWHELGGETSGVMMGTFNSSNGLNVQRLRLAPLGHKMSTTSSVASNDDLSFCARIYQKCQIVCCFCRPKYL